MKVRQSKIENRIRINDGNSEELSCKRNERSQEITQKISHGDLSEKPGRVIL
jgi:hypothetical protein